MEQVKPLKTIIKEQVEKIDQQLFGLTDYKLKAIHYFLKEIIKLDTYKLEVDIHKKEIRIQPTNHKDEDVKIQVSKEAKDIIGDFLTKKINIDGKVILL